MKKLKKLWLRLSLKLRKEIISFTHTFLAVAAGSMILGLTEGPMIGSREMFIVLLVSALRTALKAAWNSVARYEQPETKK